MGRKKKSWQQIMAEAYEAGAQRERWSERHQGITADGKPVTAKFGQEDKQGHTLLSDGHKSEQEFTGKSGDRGHDHYDGAGGGTDRGKYTGSGS